MQAFFFIGKNAQKGNNPFLVFAQNEAEAFDIANDVLADKPAFGEANALRPEAAQMIADRNNKGKFQSY